MDIQNRLGSGKKQTTPDDDSIESEYSNDFAEASLSGSYAQKSLKSSKKKLQDKAKDIEDSNAYSETFEDESLARSSKILSDLNNAKKGNNMTIVKEESIDESIKTQSKMSESMMSNAQSQSHSQSKQTSQTPK